MAGGGARGDGGGEPDPGLSEEFTDIECGVVSGDMTIKTGDVLLEAAGGGGEPGDEPVDRPDRGVEGWDDQWRRIRTKRFH